MNLKKYLSKRDLAKSREPKGSQKNQKAGTLNFCVQRHDARKLHYDFRLEYQGILLSWAVPKGPSLDPNDKRLAIKVEDHPLEYQYFEGTIPKGNYGAGTVKIWDHGTYTISETHSRNEMEKKVTQGLKEGHLPFVLHGKKLKGEFVLQKLKKDPADHSWLLIKKGDSDKLRNFEVLPKKKAAKIPDFISPMLATLVEAPFNDPNWIFEIKWDGYRVLAFINAKKVLLKSRTDHLWNAKFPHLMESLKKIKTQVILDGELVVLDEKGKPQFHLMQNYQREHQGNLFYYVFDILFKEGRDLRNLPLLKRKEILKNFLNDLGLQYVRYNDHVIGEGIPFFKEAKKLKLEGIIGKKIESTYQSSRSPDWVKIKTSERQEVVIGGFTAPQGSRKKFGALLVGFYDAHNQLIYAGHVGGGFDAKLLEYVYKKLQSHVQDECPFKDTPEGNAAIKWVKPHYVCEVSFSEWTKDNRMRQPIFHGLREDKDPKSVKKEVPKSIPGITKNKKKTTDRKDLTLSNLDKIYWPKEDITKGDLLNYYEGVADYLLPYLKGRPIILHRFPEGIEGIDFYQKDINFSHPDWIKTYSLEQEGKVNHYLLIDDVRSLLFAVNLGSIDLHPFLSRCDRLEYPDFCVIDLDPHDVSFNKVIEAAEVLHEILDEIKIKHLCKTSGGKGLHICIPLQGKYDYDQSKKFAEILAICIHKKLPKTTALERDPKKRPKKIYLDYLQNRFAQSIVAPYSVRPRPHALVSTPLSWNEVNAKLDLRDYNIRTVPKRLKEKGDLFKDVLKGGINMKLALDRLQKFL